LRAALANSDGSTVALRPSNSGGTWLVRGAAGFAGAGREAAWAETAPKAMRPEAATRMRALRFMGLLLRGGRAGAACMEGE